MSVHPPSPTSAFAIGLSGMRAAQTRLDTTAHNVANAQTPSFKRQVVQQSAVPDAGGTQTQVLRENVEQTGDQGQLARDMVEQRGALHSYAANLKTIQIKDQILGSLLDTKA